MKLTPIDEKKEIEGSLLVYRGVKLIVARSNNVNFKKTFRDNLKPYKNDFDNDRMEDSVAERLMIKCVAKTILVGWTDFKDVEGKEWEYSVANAEELLTDDKDVYEEITKFSENIDNYITRDKETLKGK